MTGVHPHPPPTGPYPGYAPHGYAPLRPANGAVAWALGLLVFAFFPLLSSLVGGGAMIVAGRLQRTNGPLAAENGRRAANWGLTYVLATVVLLGTHFGLLIGLQGRIPPGFFPMGIFITLWLLVSLVHVAVCIVGLVKANSMKVVPWDGIPFFGASHPIGSPQQIEAARIATPRS